MQFYHYFPPFFPQPKGKKKRKEKKAQQKYKAKKLPFDRLLRQRG
jgi:hypothetical protein